MLDFWLEDKEIQLIFEDDVFTIIGTDSKMVKEAEDLINKFIKEIKFGLIKER
jgi:hypothetical protein